MKVTLITHSPDPEHILASAARLCYSAADIATVMENLTPEKTAEFVDRLMELGHESPMEHVSFTFGIEGVSRALLAQITRHRIASYSVQSQRYVREKMFEYVLPPEIECVPEAKEIYIQAMEEDQRHYEELTNILKQKHLKEMLDSGMTEKAAMGAAEKKAIEDARFVLPNACTTKIMMTMNARSLMNFFHHRCCNRAQWEIRELAAEMFKLCYAVAPNLFRNAGPACAGGRCPEGKMTCGKMVEMRALYDGWKGLK
jgi:thymidylate synthase (FAD)